MEGKRIMQLLRRTLVITTSTLLLFSLLIATDLIIISSASNDILYVDSSNTQGPWNGTTQHPYQNIQDAIDAAFDETTISIAEGTYFENILIQKNLVLLGEDRDTTIIDGGKNGHVVKIQGSAGNELTLQFSSMTVRNAGGLGNDCLALSYVTSGSITDSILINSDQSDGIQLDHCTDLTIANNQILNNKGAGISLTLSTLAMVRCVSGSKVRMLSTSLSKRSMRMGLFAPVGNRSRIDPRTANSPCSITCGTQI